MKTIHIVAWRYELLGKPGEFSPWMFADEKPLTSPRAAEERLAELRYGPGYSNHCEYKVVEYVPKGSEAP